MIWGLDDVQHSHARVTSQNTPHPTAHRPTINVAHSTNSPRISKTRKHPVQGHLAQTRGHNVESPLVLATNGQDYTSQPQAAAHQRVLQSLQSNEASLAGAGIQKVAQMRSTKLPERLTKETFESDWHVLDMEGGLGLDWQSAFASQDSQISSGLSGNRQIADFFKSSAPPFLPGGIRAGHSYPRIFVEPRPNELNRTSQRPSALELAHQYRQHQQLQNALPTPPRSSSTQWSPYFTSYQDSSTSPDLVSSLPPRFSSVHTQPHYNTSDSCHPLQRFVHNRTGDIDLTSKTTSFGASMLVDSATSPRSSIKYSPDVTVSLAKFLQHRNTTFSPSVATPPHPGPPPNTPLPPVPNHKPSANSGFFVTPPSPTSPDTRSRCPPYNQPRSIPLTRLIQRRLSSVPEEDLGAIRERTRSPSPSFSNQDHSFSHLQVQALTGWQSHHVENPHPIRTPSPVAVTLAPQTRTPDVAMAKKSSAKVRLPNPRANDAPVTGQRPGVPHFKKKLKGKKVKQPAPLKATAGT